VGEIILAQNLFIQSLLKVLKCIVGIGFGVAIHP